MNPIDQTTLSPEPSALQTNRPAWSSQFGFIISSAGSAVGLANIWRFPYLTGSHGGAAFLVVYLACLLLLGLPVFLCEVTLGRHVQGQPVLLFRKLAKKKWLGAFGYLPVFNGFMVSSFYSVIAGTILGYLFEIGTGSFDSVTTLDSASQIYRSFISDSNWTIMYHCLFLALSGGVLFFGVKGGIERSNRILMPLLLLILLFLNGYAFTQPNSLSGLRFLFIPDWSQITSQTIILALGHAFFTLSLGQGTMLTYGSYLPKNSNLLKSCFLVALFDTTIAVLAGSAIFMFIFSQLFAPDSGPSLLFTTMPVLFGKIPGGFWLTLTFFMLLAFAALTSEISALEPVIAYLTEEIKLSRRTSVIIATLLAMGVGIPAALSTNRLSGFLIQDKNPFEWMAHITLDILIPVAALATLWLATFHLGMRTFLKELQLGDNGWLVKYPILRDVITVLIATVSPILLSLILLFG